MDINCTRKQVDENKDRTSSVLSNVITEDTSHTSLAIDNEMEAARTELYDIQTANFSLDEQIFKMEMLLLKVYEEAFDHVEEVYRVYAIVCASGIFKNLSWERSIKCS